MSADDFKAALLEVGYEVSKGEVAALLRFVSHNERVSRPTFLATQLDWRKLQENHR